MRNTNMAFVQLHWVLLGMAHMALANTLNSHLITASPGNTSQTQPPLALEDHNSCYAS